MFDVRRILFAFSTNRYLPLWMMPLIGASMIIQMAGSNTLLQTLAEDDKRGRIMAMFTMCFMGTVPIGSLLCGLAAGYFGPQATVAGGGLICIAGALYFNRLRAGLQEMVQPIYVRRGILPEVATGVQTATAATERVAG